MIAGIGIIQLAFNAPQSRGGEPWKGQEIKGKDAIMMRNRAADYIYMYIYYMIYGHSIYHC